MVLINIPKKIKIKLYENWIEIEGPLGIQKKMLLNNIKIFLEKKNNTRFLWLDSDNPIKTNMYCSFLNKIFYGVWKGYTKKLNLIGVGYKVFNENNLLIFKIGYSHFVNFEIPKNIEIKITNVKGVLTLIIFGIDLELVSQTASKIRALKPVEPYKGKGIKYLNEVVRRKIGKKTNV